MDQFYLENAALYQRLVKAVKIPPSSSTGDAARETTDSNMVVSARVRPLLEDDIAAGFPCAVFPRANHKGMVDTHDLYNHPRGRPIVKSFKYQVDRLFDSQTTTEDIYSSLVADLIPLAWNGGIGTLFAYGQTGSGKTFTVSRLEQLVAEALTDRSDEDERQVYFTIVELAGNSAYDLLNSRKPVSILEDSLGVTQMAGAEAHHVRGRTQVMELIERASIFRQTAPTLKNGASSRSHGICRIRIKDPAAGTEGLLYLVDLAGSEAARDVTAHGADRMRETRDINMSLSVLKDCIRGKAMAEALKSAGGPKPKSKKPHIPFRQSALTKVLKHVFDPVSSKPCKTVVIACINPSLGDVGPSKSTLRYAEMLRVALPPGAEDTKDDAPASEPLVRNPLLAGRSSSGDPNLNNIGLPFKERIRPGMVISWNPTPEVCLSLGMAEAGVKLAVVLCPAMAACEPVKDREHMHDESETGYARYICAVVTHSQVGKAYELSLWRQTVVAVDAMEEEVMLEYDADTRYYYVTT